MSQIIVVDYGFEATGNQKFIGEVEIENRVEYLFKASVSCNLWAEKTKVLFRMISCVDYDYA